MPSFELPRRYGTSNLRAVTDGWRVLVTLLVNRVRPRLPAGSDEPRLPADGAGPPALTVAPEPADSGLAAVDLVSSGGTPS